MIGKYQFRRRKSPLVAVPWWFLDILDDDEEIIETFELGDKVSLTAKRWKITSVFFVVIEGFEEHHGDVGIRISVPGHPELKGMKVSPGEIKHMSPLERLAAEAED